MNAEEVEELLISIEACSEARKWAKGKTLAEIWDQCERIDWICWLLGRMEGKEGWPDRKAIVLAACSFAELALPFVKAGEERPRQAIETARAWARGEVTRLEVKIARDAAADAAYADAAATADYAAAAAAYAANTADYAAAYAAYAAADTAAYAAYAAADGAANAARAAAATAAAAAAVAVNAAAAALAVAVAVNAAYAVAYAVDAAAVTAKSKCIEIIRAQLRPQCI